MGGRSSRDPGERQSPGGGARAPQRDARKRGVAAPAPAESGRYVSSWTSSGPSGTSITTRPSTTSTA